MSVSDHPTPSGFPFCPNVLEKWNDENIELLRDLIVQKLSALQIAKTMSIRTEFTFTRNAIIGKARRLGIALLGNDNKPRPIIVKPPKPRKYNPVTTLKVRPPNATTSVKLPTFKDVLPTYEDVVANPKCLSILEIERGQCYWPTNLAFGDSAPVTFCGHPTGDNEVSWCRAHQSLGYTKPHQRVGWGYR